MSRHNDTGIEWGARGIVALIIAVIIGALKACGG